MIKKQIIVDIQFANEWQEEIHMRGIEVMLGVAKASMTGNGITPKACSNKKNNMEYKITTIEK